MKVYCLSSDAAKPCFVISFRGLMIMLDCGLSAQSVLSFLPLPPVPSARLASLPSYSPPHINDPLLEGELKECCGRVFVDSLPEFCPPLEQVVDFAQLDAILISNYTCMMALPFVTEGTGFKGQVYATEPTLQIGRFYLEELSEWLREAGGGAGGGAGGARRWKELLHLLPAPLSQAARPRAWRRLYSAQVLAKALARVRVVGYDERVELFGALEASPVSSGFCLGSANWVLRSPHEKIAYVSGSSTLTTHPRPINQAALRGADLLLLAGLTQTPAHNPDNMLGDLCVHAGVTLRGGGAVLLPVYPSGVLYDLLECLSMHLDTAGLSQIPLYVISPVADASLAYSNILAEWVSTAKQARVYVPEEPFPHAALARAGRLRHAARLHDHSFSEHFRTPCVVFCGHPSLRFGAAVHLLELWAANPAHAVIFTEPDFPYLEALAPFQPLAMKAFHCPIDTSLNYSQCNKLVRELRPRALAVPEQYAPPRGAAGAGGAGAGARACVTADVPVLALRRGGVAAVAARRTLARAAAAPALLPALRPRAPLTAELHVRDNVLTLLPPPAPLQPSAEPDYDLGPPNVDALVRCLAAEGLGAARVEASPAGAVLHLPRHDALLHVERAHTHVFCEPRGRPALRRALRAAARRDPAPL
ncbi:integrator complex subunit 9 [Plutella xylostella]|uniref:integrator complex subunit 9 n=1 Tax=Plutella xylostella TaxID=51655 RepID=UPI002032B1DF|nr:integrator complex subunit 9 [Plutella xylostella]